MRWLPPEKLHLTLLFLGATDASRVRSIAAAVGSVADGQAPIAVETGKAGGRIHGRRGGVAWLRLYRGERKVTQLSRQLDRAIGSNAYTPGKPPHPHLTVARGATEEMLACLIEGRQAIDLRWFVDRIVLFRSHTDAQGSRYEELTSFPLTAGPQTA